MSIINRYTVEVVCSQPLETEITIMKQTLVDERNDSMRDLLFTVHQHDGDDGNVKTTYSMVLSRNTEYRSFDGKLD